MQRPTDRANGGAEWQQQGRNARRFGAVTKEFSGKQFTVGAAGFTGDATADPSEQWQWTVWMTFWGPRAGRRTGAQGV